MMKKPQKKEINFRIIELPAHQILVSKDFDERENDKPIISITFFYEGVKMTTSMGFNNEKARDGAFNDLKIENIDEFVKDMINAFQ